MVEDVAARAAARSYGMQATYFEDRAHCLDFDAEQADVEGKVHMAAVLREGAERARRFANLLRRAMLAEMTPDDLDD